MAIEKGDFIKVSYTGKFDGETIFDTTHEEVAKSNNMYNDRGMYGGDVVIVGARHIIIGLDDDFVGKDVGYTGSVEIPPEKAYGGHDIKLVESISIAKFKDRNVYEGLEVEINGKKGIVIKVIGRRVRVDMNNLLAGKTVTYEYTIEKVLKDGVEKIQGLFALYTGLKNPEVDINDGIATIITPVMLSYNQRWLMSKSRAANEILENVGVKEVRYVEKYPEAPIEAETKAEESEDTKSGEMNKSNLYEYLISIVKNGSNIEDIKIEYGQVMKHFDENKIVFPLIPILNEICDENAKKSEPFLPAIVVSKKSHIPGKGFFENWMRPPYRDYNGPAEGPEAQKVYEEELERVFNYWHGGATESEETKSDEE
ncbi:MAG: FKBP-type peptidyl-prolyl cis-trans isomerase [Methanosarcinaceae archaeon]